MSKFIKINMLNGDEMIIPLLDIVMQKYNSGLCFFIPKQELPCEDPYWREISREEYDTIICEIGKYA